MTCDFCRGRTVKRRVKKHHWHKGRLYIVENVPAEVCRQCGERYYHATTLDAIDRLLDTDHPVKESLQVEVVSL
jgi:YgiT-type zinc finger domain-containing protein